MLYQCDLDHIQLYSKCHRKYFYNLTAQVYNPEYTKDYMILKHIIKQAYINLSQHGYTPQWDTIKNRVNKACFEHTDINNKEQFAAGYKQSIRLMDTLHKWYKNYFKDSATNNLINLELSHIRPGIKLTHQLDILSIVSKDNIVPIVFNDDKVLASNLYNNLKYKSILWLLFKESGLFPKTSTYIEIGPESIHYHSIHNKIESLSNIEKYINSILDGISNREFYPAVSEQCNSCHFKSICSM